MKYRIQAGLPGVPYSSFEVTFDAEEAIPTPAEINEYAAEWAKAFREAFPDVPERQVDEAPPQRSAPAQRPQNAAGGRPQGNGSQYGGPWKCPEHGVEVRPSTRNKNMDFDEELGTEVPASWFHSLGEGEGTHSVWRSQLVKA